MGCWKVLSSGMHLGYPMGMHWDYQKVLQREMCLGNHWVLYLVKNLVYLKEINLALMMVEHWVTMRGKLKACCLVMHSLLDFQMGHHWGRSFHLELHLVHHIQH